MVSVGVDDGEIDRTEDLYRKTDSKRLSQQSESGDLKQGREMIFTHARVSAAPGTVSDDAG